MHFGLLLQLITCSFLGMEGGLTQFFELSDNVEMFYINPYRNPAHLDAMSVYLLNSLTTIGCLPGVFLTLWIPFLVRISTSAWS